MTERKLLYEAQMRAYVRDANTTLPAGWRIAAHVLRSFKDRNHWRLDARRDGEVRATCDVYQIRATLPVIVRWIEAQPVGVGVTVGADGYVTSIEDVA